ncbi:MAG: hypothetical protein GY808_10340 [Gammaproteobacteria bacterium]|nr:hypothetical protein [Gammaproteobacteria bacterium]
MKVGRNDPCPCGSGKKYKHCCLSVTDAVGSLVTQQNQMPQDDFLGLSSDQVYRMLNFAFDSPEFFQFPDQLTIKPDAPILILMEHIVAAIDDKGLKATQAKGNLPQKLCREVWSNYSKLYPDDIFSSFHKVNREDDFFELHVTRVVLELAGLLRKTKGRFYLTQKYKKVASKSGLKALYPIIFKTYCRKFNWGYWDHYSEAPFIQQSFLFTLYLLKQHGDKMEFTSVYTDDFLRAFPMVIDQMDESSYSTPEEDLKRCYYYRVHQRFLVFLGLAELEVIKGDELYERKYKIKKTSLLDVVIHFNLTGSETNTTIH